MAIEKNTPNYLKKSNQPFTTILNDVINAIIDRSALGVYIYLASKPSGWNVSIKQLMNHFCVGRDAIKKDLKTLKTIGLLESICHRNEKGMITHWETKLYSTLDDSRDQEQESAHSEHQNTEIPYSGSSTILKIQRLDNPASGKSAPINKRMNINKSVCEKRARAREEKIPTHISLSSILENTSLVNDFSTRFRGRDVTIEALYNDFVKYYDLEGKLGTEKMFRSWIRNERIENYSKTQSKSSPSISPDDLELLQNWKYNQEHPNLPQFPLTADQELRATQLFKESVLSKLPSSTPRHPTTLNTPPTPKHQTPFVNQGGGDSQLSSASEDSVASSMHSCSPASDHKKSNVMQEALDALRSLGSKMRCGQLPSSYKPRKYYDVKSDDAYQPPSATLSELRAEGVI